MSKRVPRKVLHFYILSHLTLTRGAWATKGVLGVGGQPSSQLFIITFPWGIWFEIHLCDL